MNQASSTTAFAALLLTVAWGAVVFISQPTPPLSPFFLLYLLGALALELGAARLEHWGFISLACGCYLAAASDHDVGTRAAAFILAVCLTARQVTRSGGSWSKRLTEAASEAVPLLTLLGLVEAFDSPLVFGLGLLVYLGLSYIMPGLVSGRKQLLNRVTWNIRLHSLLFLAGACAAGRLLALHPDRTAWTILSFGLVLLALAYGLLGAVRSRELQGMSALSFRLSRRERDLAQLDAELKQLEAGLAQRSQERQFLETANRRLASVTSLTQAQETLLDLLEGQFDSQVVALFLADEHRLAPVAVRGASPTRKEAREAAVEEAWREGRPAGGRYTPGPERLCSEKFCLAAPLSGFGVVLLARSQKPYGASEREMLWLVARQVALVLDGLSRTETQNREIAYVSAERRKLSRWLYRLNRLLDGARAVFSANEPQEIFAQARATVDALVPNEGFYLIHREGGCEFPAGQVAAELLSVAELVTRTARPVLAESADKAPMRLPDGVASLLAAPLSKERAVVLTSAEPGHFDREHLSLVTLLAQQAAIALERVDLTREFTRASKMAAIGQMAAGLSHELNTPLGIIQLALESAAAQLDTNPARSHGHLRDAERALRRVEGVAEGLLYYATSYGVSEREAVAVDGLVSSALAKLDERSIEVRGLEQPVVVRGHLLDLRQALVQLLRNACDAAGDEGRVVVKVVVEPDTTSIEVHDDGPGIDPEIFERITEPFFTTKPVGQGLGLGLSICERVVSEHDGRLEFGYSFLGGTCARIRLPGERRTRT
ncbi:MAG: sensor histidine kinase [Vulcanimicrobiota bacterium]